MTAAFAEFQRRAEEAGCEGQWLTECHWQVHGLRRIDVYPRGGVFFEAAQKWYGSPWLAIEYATQLVRHEIPRKRRRAA